jgi:hypothetical protein
MKTLSLPVVVLALLAVRPAVAADAPSYTRDVKPFLVKYCTECHNDTKTKAGYNLESYDTLLKAARKGAAVVPGSPDKSMLVRTLSGSAKQMPPRKSVQPKAAEIAMIKEWIKAGARDDTSADADRSSKPEAKQD